MRYEFIVQGAVPDDVLVELPELAAARTPRAAQRCSDQFATMPT
jgi:hypothetical protein